jgi:hypothetical protein
MLPDVIHEISIVAAVNCTVMVTITQTFIEHGPGRSIC